jgi:nucleotide-binding universal stress UspA family protein
MIKTIFVPLTGNQIDDAALEAAVVVARQFCGHISGTYLTVSSMRALDFASSRLDTGLYKKVIVQLQDQDEKENKEVRDGFEEFMKSRSIELTDKPSKTDSPTASWEEVYGEPSDMVAIHAGAFDLIVTSHPALGPTSTPAPILDAAIFSTARPVLFAWKQAPPELSRSVLIAWNRGAESRRAVADAMPFLERAENVTIITVTTGAKEGPEPEEIARTLAWHGVTPEIKQVPPDKRSVGQMLIDEMRVTSSDLLVMGAYSKHRIQDRLVRGVTREILSNGGFPVLMAR